MEETDESDLEHVRNIQLMIILNNQEVKANEQYILYKKAEIEKLSAKCDEQVKEIATLEEKCATLTSDTTQSELSVSISNECFKTLGDHKIAMQQEKEDLEEYLEILKNKYEHAIKEYNEKYEEIRKVYEENTPGYEQLQKLQEKNKELENEIKVLQDDLETEKKIKDKSKDIKKQEFYRTMVQFAGTVISYKKNKETFMLCRQLEKEEIQLLKKLSEKQNQFKRTFFERPKMFSPIQMPTLKLQSSLISRPLLITNLLPSKKYNLLENEGLNQKDTVEGIKKRKLNPPVAQTESKSQSQQINASPYFQNSDGTPQKIQTNYNSQEQNPMKAFNKNLEKVKVIDVKVIPPSPVSFTKKQNTNKDNIYSTQKDKQFSFSSFNSNNGRGQFTIGNPKINQSTTTNRFPINDNVPLRAIQDKKTFSCQKSTENQPIMNSQDLFFSQESVANNQLRESQTGLTPDMVQFKIKARNDQIENKENIETQGRETNDQEAGNQSFVYKGGNCAAPLNNSSIFGQFDNPNETPHFQFRDVTNELDVSGIEMQHYVDTGNENYVYSPMNPFLLNTSEGKDGDNEENKNKQSNNFLFKFGETTSNNEPSGQNKLFDMYY